MGDMKDALRKAGLVSEKQARRAAHEKRVRRKELGADGLSAEREHKEATYRAEQEARRRADQAAAAAHREEQAARQQHERLAQLITGQDELPQHRGTRRFSFVAEAKHIRSVDVSDLMLRRLIQGDAAIVAAAGFVRGDYAILPAKAARALRQLAPDRILHWNVDG